ncbi:MAG: carboxypeptidase regulatory-like domain-containing protein, partial [Vicinamibacteria bacterium]
VTGADVTALQYRYLAGARRLVPAPGSSRGRTDDQGSFRLFGLTPGEYIVSATLREGQGAANANLEAEEPSGYAPTYYPGVPNVAEAQSIPLGVGQENGAVTFGLLMTRLVRVSGRVIDSSGQPLTRGAVVLLPADTIRQGMAGANAGGAAIRGDGTFQVPGVAPGNYILLVRPGGGRGGFGGGFAGGGDGEFARLPLGVGSADMRDVLVATAPGAVARGIVTTDQGQPLPAAGRQMSVAAIGADPSMPTGGAQARVAEDGTFELRGLSESRLFRVGAPAGWQVKQILLNGEDVTDTPVEFPLGSTTTGIRIVMTEASTELSGTVVDDRGTPVLDAAVVVFAADEARWTFQSRFIQAARPDQDGRYRIRGLPPHDDYRIIAVQGLEDGQAGDPSFLRALVDAAERLSLNEGEVKTMDVRVK